MNFKVWLRDYSPIKTKSVTNYYQAIYGLRINKIAEELHFRPVYEYESLEPFLVAQAAIEAHPEFVEFNTRGKGMYSAALKKYAAYLAYMEDNHAVAEDQADIEKRSDLTPTEKTIMSRARVGQGGYRQRVLAYWDNRCAVTRYPLTSFLLASHIKPWRQATDAERLDEENGLALSPTLDRAFDQGYITFDERSGAICISPLFVDCARLGIYDDMRLVRSPSAVMRTYLEFHRDMIFLPALK